MALDVISSSTRNGQRVLVCVTLLWSRADGVLHRLVMIIALHDLSLCQGPLWRVYRSLALANVQKYPVYVLACSR